jgi:fibronectin type 3 domain-containing protein
MTHSNTFRYFLLVPCFISVFTARVVLATQLEAPLNFDFGSKNSPILSSSILVTEHTVYDKNTGFGLLSKVEDSYSQWIDPKKNEMTIDGIRSDKAISFQVDLAPGSYWIELFMGSGEKGNWLGKIKANNVLMFNKIKKGSEFF